MELVKLTYKTEIFDLHNNDILKKTENIGIRI